MDKKTKKRLFSICGSVVRWVFLLSIGYIAVYPLLVMISNSIMPMDDVLDQSVVYIPKSVTFDYFKEALERLDFQNALKNTLLFPILAGLIEVAVCAVTAYGFSRFEFKEKNVLFGLVLLTIVVPATLLMIPQYTGFYNFDPVKLLAIVNKIFGTKFNINILNTGFTMW
ncbi:MAG: carbohydrate ABC transporter permease [Clostridia bacterium]|nr:carbohydrate ABC transporter permease [Clostridia bacterium]